MPTTTNYGWTTPADTDLVKDGAAAIRTLGSSVDSTLKTQIDAQIPKSLVTTKGDLIVATGSGTVVRQAVGTNGQVLTADSTQADGVAWTTLASGGLTTIASGSFSGTSITISSIPNTYKQIFLYVKSVTDSAGQWVHMRINGNSSANYNTTSINQGNSTWNGQSGQSYWRVFYSGNNTNAQRSELTYSFLNYNSSTTYKYVQWVGANTDGLSTGSGWNNNETGAISSITLFGADSVSFTGGTYILYGAK